MILIVAIVHLFGVAANDEFPRELGASLENLGVLVLVHLVAELAFL